MLTKEKLTEKSLNELREIAKDLKLSVKPDTVKANISAILAYQTQLQQSQKSEIAVITDKNGAKKYVIKDDTVLILKDGIPIKTFDNNLKGMTFAELNGMIANYVHFAKLYPNRKYEIALDNGLVCDILNFRKSILHAIKSAIIGIKEYKGQTNKVNRDIAYKLCVFLFANVDQDLSELLLEQTDDTKVTNFTKNVTFAEINPKLEYFKANGVKTAKDLTSELILKYFGGDYASLKMIGE